MICVPLKKRVMVAIIELQGQNIATVVRAMYVTWVVKGRNQTVCFPYGFGRCFLPKKLKQLVERKVIR